MIKRLREFIQSKEISVSAFEKKISASDGMIRRAIKNNSDIQSKWIPLISDNYPELNIEWLINGRGSMLNSEKNICVKKGTPFYNLSVSAGPLGVLNFSENKTKPDGYVNLEAFKNCDAVLPIIGISMEPEILSGDLIGIKKIIDFKWEFIETGKVYMIITREDRMIKHIKKTDDPSYIVCSSPNYGDFKVLKCEILEIYYVKTTIRVL